MSEHGKATIYMLELIKFVINNGGKYAKVFDQMTDEDIAEFVSDIPEVEIVF